MSGSNNIISNFLSCFLSPRLYRIYNIHQQRGPYQPNTWEKWGDTVIQASVVLWHVTLYACPILAYTIYKRGYFTSDSGFLILKLGSAGALLLVIAYILRAFGRVTNPTYMEFNEMFRHIIRNYNDANKKLLQNYEFDYSAWPIDFELKDLEKIKGKNNSSCNTHCSGSSWCSILRGPSNILGFLAIHSFGIKMIYPGSISALNYIIQHNLEVGRKKLIEEKKSERFKLRTPDGNDLDTMFVDQRGKTSNGSKLVICTEGNAGFYEIGIMVTPLELGYSVLGWNHPGFGCSTGTPYPHNEKCAAETVIQFAFQKLKFIPEDVILFGWSIGGFASSYLATLYPDLRAVILDATFDDILPLARKQMPNFLEPVVNATIRNHANLDVANQLVQYNGPILLIRRSEDEIISLVEGDLTSNRGNYLLIKILRSRYPNLFNDESEKALWSWFAVSAHKKDLVYEKYGVNLEACKAEYNQYKTEHKRQYPMKFGSHFSSSEKVHMLLYLASIYMVDFPSTHCTSLPAAMFHSFDEI